jgi:hypothetical protein
MKKEKLTEEYCKEMDNYAGELLNERWGKISDYLHEKLSDFDITDMYRETNEKFEERYGKDWNTKGSICDFDRTDIFFDWLDILDANRIPENGFDMEDVIDSMIDALIDRVNYHQIVQMRKEEQDIVMEQSILMN